MPVDSRLSQTDLHGTFANAIGRAVESRSSLEQKPLDLVLHPPLPRLVRAYVYNATRPPGGRATGEHKIQLIVPGQPRGERGNFNDDGGQFVLLVGIEPTLGVIILWDAGLYRDFSYSRNVQVKGETVYHSLGGEIVRQQRWVRCGGGGSKQEIVIAATPDRLYDAILLRVELTYERLVGI